MAITLTLTAAVTALQQGGVIAYPTEAVWGLGCDPRQEAAVHALLQIKQRTSEKGLILVTAELNTLQDWLDLDTLPPERLREVQTSWPGPHTWILPASTRAPHWITGRHNGLAVRVSAHPLVTALCRVWNMALVSTSANLAGQPPARRREDLDPALLPHLAGIVDGPTGGLAQPTSIRDARSGHVLRP
ncbi:tRNA threonylcarbamoyladenosine biosynthesis protein RimN [Xylella taiwanensis]|uniref:Threonylcarbamoyl-AMP synthase n=1 Tax=Xylella taiwanensis TaxID=1444770 RepID=Z9JGR0_9GAMM|nr:Sua5/YciO/YrdC/YwlC family protein [Xylella taiwanensis]AXI82881.1 tRNA threonylcarbamoyladenosine biosynthesis protein RimN [Xylella taiwanensis]EWS77555.1 tRNA threonylcarbamoyladenosine biosynthesis protein RimN [Xylella taiwanensis]MCD8455897.1 Sua5/YciO/YrdC/YwlC family protein [Xylella taiwanensis]MCD8458301.1 Sua5/YciO/YrdC/YwlC family protein [Xylella taiwanensis]MCD8460439.1 Sua5/YciO/YrdC/YwlC family protein [Xylella taiwanensis]